MNIVRITAAGRVVAAGPRLLLLSPPSIRGIGTLIMFLKDRIPAPEGAPDGWLPEYEGPAAHAEYATPVGLAVLLYVATRRDHPTLTLDDCAALATRLDDDGLRALANVALVRRACRPARAPRGRIPSGGGRGIEAVDFGPVFERESTKRFPPQVLAEMTMDQFENLIFGGELEPEDALSLSDVIAICEAHRPPKIRPAGEG